jgi:ribosomal protein S12 methylthiotransferase
MTTEHEDIIVNEDNAVAKVGIVSLGCAKNLVNTEQMMYLLKQAGYFVTGETQGADVVIINTCGFIESAKVEAIDTILEFGDAREDGSIGKLIVTGCLAERYKSEIISEIPEIDGIVGVGSFDEIVGAVEKVLSTDEKLELFGDIDAPVSEAKRILTTSSAWAYIKIAEGCDNRCSFCVIPSLRGKFRSRPLENILAEAADLAGRGIRELILVAQDSTRYGLDLYGKRRLPELLTGLCKIEGLKWIRLHYLYPDEVGDDVIDVIANNDKILNYLDIPIQHINDEVLKKMNRRATGSEIKDMLNKIKARIPGVVIRTSIITGLPGEGEEEFEQLCDFIREEKMQRAGVFPYSPEEGTPAARMERPDSEMAMQRAEILAEIQAGIIDEYNESRLGTVATVLIEGFEDDHYYGRSFAESPDVDGYINVYGDDLLLGAFIDVKITGVIAGELAGEPLLFERDEY